QAVERVKAGEALEHHARGEREAQHLLAHRDRVLVQAGLLVAVHRLEIAPRGALRVPLLVEEVGQQHGMIGIRVARSDELLVLAQRPIQVPVQNEALGTALDLDGSFQVVTPRDASAPATDQAFKTLRTVSMQRSATDATATPRRSKPAPTRSLSAPSGRLFRLI